jgi:hypothetical protein
LTRETADFCNREGLSSYVAAASKFIAAHFCNVKSIDSEVLRCPDTDGRFLVIQLEVEGEIDTVLDMYDRYTAAWVSAVPWPERGKMNLSYVL